MMNRLVGLVVVVALSGCAVPLGDDAESSEAMVTSPVQPASSVCWVETTHRDVPIAGEVTASGVLVRHAKGNLLIDAGASTRHDQEIAVYSGEDRFFYESIVGLMKPERPLPEALAQVGVRAADVDWFLPTHVHADHVGGMMDMPNMPVFLTPAEAGVVEQGRKSLGFEVVPAHAERLSPLVTPLALHPTPYEGFAESRDLFLDGSVVIVPLPGHTAGSVGVFLRLPNGTRVLHVGDTVSSLAELEAGEGKRWPMDRTDADREETLERVKELKALHERLPDLRIVPAHDRKAWVAAFGAPATCS